MPQKRSKKFTVLVAVFILFAGMLFGGFLVLKSRSGSASISQQINYLLGNQNQTATEKDDDADNDGLKDWEENIYKTDAKKSDTDSDGYLDGEEAASGYDPAKKAPGDELPGKTAKSPRPLPKNLTAALSQKLSQAIVEGKIESFGEDGQPLGVSQIESALNQNSEILQTISQGADFTLPKISDTEIIISGDTGKPAISAYLLQARSALVKITASEKSEIEIFIKAMETNDFSEVQKIQKNYQTSYEQLKAVPTPIDFVLFHKDILAALLATKNIYAAIQNFNQDPLKAAIAISRYGDINKQTIGVLNRFIEQINKLNQK